MTGFDWLEGLVDTETNASGRALHKRSAAPVREMLELLDNPQYNYPAIHVTGTNGKGSVVSFASAMLDAMNVRSGSFTSPDLGDLLSRIKVCGVPISETGFELELALIASLVESFGLTVPSRFEAVTAATLAAFSSAGVEAAVVEVGMGGSSDATNVLNAAVAVVTLVGHDHLAAFGGDLASVATEKAGIVTMESELIIGSVPADLMDTFTSRTTRSAQVLGRDITVTEDLAAVGGRRIGFSTRYGSHEEIFLPMIGTFQPTNFALATAAAETLLDKRISEEVLLEAASSASLPGRSELISRSPTVVLDVAHNREAAAELGRTLRETFGYEVGWVILMGLTHARRADEFLDALGDGSLDRLIAVDMDVDVQVDPHEIAEISNSRGVPSIVSPSVADALTYAKLILQEGQILVVTGSHYLVGQARSILVSS